MKKRYFYWIILLIILIVIKIPTFGQSDIIREDLKQISMNYYHNNNLLKYNTDIYYYALENPTEIFDSLKAEYRKQGWNILMKMGKIEMLINQHFQIVANNDNKILNISKNPKLDKQWFSLELIDTILQSGNSSYVIVKEEIDIIKLRYKSYLNLVTDSIDLAYDRKNHLLVSITYYFNNPGLFSTYDYGDFKPVIHIRLHNQYFLKPDISLFDENKFISKSSNNEYAGVNKYKNYKISVSGIQPQ